VANYKLDIFQVLGQIDRKDIDFYDNLLEDEQKALQPFVVMRWLSGTKDAPQVYVLNEFVNPYVFELLNHKGLLYKLLTVATNGKPRRYNWLKVKSKKGSSIPFITAVVCEYFGYSKRQTGSVIPLLSDGDILEYAQQLGRQSAEITKIKAELKNR
jgi:hypothetical protein